MIVERVSIGDSDDPYVIAGFALSNWKDTPKGKWVFEHAIEQPVFHCTPNVFTYGYDAVIGAKFTEEDKTVFLLKWGIK